MTFPNSTPLACALIATLAMTACGKPAEQTAPKQTAQPKAEQSQTETTPTPTASVPALKIGSDLTFPPYEYLDNDKPAGFDIELMNAIAKQAGAEVEYVDTRFTNLMPGLDGKKYKAVISALYVNEKRLEKYDMIPYFTTDEVVMVKTGSSYQPKGAMDLCGKAVATMKGAILAEQLQDISDNKCVPANKESITIREFPTSPEATQALLSGAVDAQYDDSALGHSAVKKLAGKIEISSTESFYPIVGGIVVRKGDTATYNLINNALETLRASGQYSTLLNNYGLTPATEADIAELKAKASKAE